MATEPEDDELILDTETDPENPEDDEAREGEDNLEVNDEDEEVPSFGDESEEQAGDSGLVKHLRRELKMRSERISELERTALRDEPIEVGPEPQMWDDGIDGDETKYRDAIRAYDKRVSAAERQKGQSSEAEQAERAAWEEELNRVQREKLQLEAEDADDAFDTVRASLNTLQQAVLIKASENTGKLIYALGKNPERLAEIAGIQDPLKLAVRIAKLEGQLKMVKRRKAPDPERIERGSGKIARVAPDKALEAAEKKAEKTGERTELIKLKKQMQTKKAK